MTSILIDGPCDVSNVADCKITCRVCGLCPETGEVESIRIRFLRNTRRLADAPYFYPASYSCPRADAQGCASRGEGGGNCPVFLGSVSTFDISQWVSGR